MLRLTIELLETLEALQSTESESLFNTLDAITDRIVDYPERIRKAQEENRQRLTEQLNKEPIPEYITSHPAYWQGRVDMIDELQEDQ